MSVMILFFFIIIGCCRHSQITYSPSCLSTVLQHLISFFFLNSPLFFWGTFPDWACEVESVCVCFSSPLSLKEWWVTVKVRRTKDEENSPGKFTAQCSSPLFSLQHQIFFLFASFFSLLWCFMWLQLYFFSPLSTNHKTRPFDLLFVCVFEIDNSDH